ncbi:MAG: DUF4364 family protein [Lachnospirales bacterium]
MNTAKHDNFKNKLFILYLLDRIDLPLSYDLIIKCVNTYGFMDFITLQECLEDMLFTGHIEREAKEKGSVEDKNKTRYVITARGTEVLNQFEAEIPSNITCNIKHYIEENRVEIKRKYENVAHYYIDKFEGENSGYIVKCGSYEDNTTLMELKLSVTTKEQAERICSTWKKNVSMIYSSIMNELTKEP